MIRCDHCGWSNNPDGAKKCQKCNQELVVLPPVPSGGNKMESDRPTRESRSECPKCGYPLSSESSFCPSCGASLSAAPSSNVDSSMKKTVRDLPSEMKPVVSVDMKHSGSGSCRKSGLCFIPIETNRSEYTGGFCFRSGCRCCIRVR